MRGVTLSALAADGEVSKAIAKQIDARKAPHNPMFPLEKRLSTRWAVPLGAKRIIQPNSRIKPLLGHTIAQSGLHQNSGRLLNGPHRGIET